MKDTGGSHHTQLLLLQGFLLDTLAISGDGYVPLGSRDKTKAITGFCFKGFMATLGKWQIDLHASIWAIRVT